VPKRMIALSLILMLILVACRQEEPTPTTDEDINIDIAFEPAELFVTDDSTVIITLTDNTGQAIEDAIVNVRGDMSHAGMTPVLREITDSSEGVYTSDYEWTMAGDWNVEIVVTLPDGTTTGETFTFTVEGEMGDMDGMGDMEMETEEADMEGMEMETEEANMEGMEMETEEASD
jgi:YtkA-like